MSRSADPPRRVELAEARAGPRVLTSRRVGSRPCARPESLQRDRRGSRNATDARSRPGIPWNATTVGDAGPMAHPDAGNRGKAGWTAGSTSVDCARRRGFRHQSGAVPILRRRWCPSGAIGDEKRRLARPAARPGRAADEAPPTGRSRARGRSRTDRPWSPSPALAGVARSHGRRAVVHAESAAIPARGRRRRRHRTDQAAARLNVLAANQTANTASTVIRPTPIGDLGVAPVAVEQGARRVDGVGQRVERREELQPVRRQRHRQQDPGQQQERHHDAVDERRERVLALERQRRRVRQRGHDEPDEGQQPQGHDDARAGRREPERDREHDQQRSPGRAGSRRRGATRPRSIAARLIGVTRIRSTTP